MNAGQFRLKNMASGSMRAAGVSGNSRQRRWTVRAWRAHGLQVKRLYVRSLAQAVFRTARG